MSNATRLMAAVIGVGALLWASGSTPQAGPRYAEPVRDYAVSGPYTHDNLSIFLLHGPDTLPPRPVKTLDEALAAGTAVVHETGTVNTLCVENLSSDDDLMIQNGDILKGGKQDRVAQLAMILPPKSGKVAMPAFCVESGRWTNRGQEAATHFASNPGKIAGKDLKNAVNTAGVQGEVWKNVAAQQAALSANVGKPVNGTASPSSLQLAMEDKELQAKLAGYRAALANTLDGKKWVVGYAIAVNGKVTGAEVFGSGVLLAKAWPKAVQAAAVEALSEKQDGGKFAAVTEDAVSAFLADAGRDEVMPAREQAREQLTASSFAPVSWTSSGGGQFGNLGGQFGNQGGGIQGGSGTQNGVGRYYGNPTYQGRSGSTQERLVLGGGGQTGGTNDPVGRAVAQARAAYAEDSANFATRLSATPQVPAPQGETQVIALESVGAVVVRGSQPIPQNALQQLAGNPAPGWQVGHRVDIPVGGLPTPAPAQPTVNRSAISAPPVSVNRTTGKNGVMVESRDRANPGVVIHRTFIAK